MNPRRLVNDHDCAAGRLLRAVPRPEVPDGARARVCGRLAAGAGPDLWADRPGRGRWVFATAAALRGYEPLLGRTDDTGAEALYAAAFCEKSLGRMDGAHEKLNTCLQRHLQGRRRHDVEKALEGRP